MSLFKVYINNDETNRLYHTDKRKDYRVEKVVKPKMVRDEHTVLVEGYVRENSKPKKIKPSEDDVKIYHDTHPSRTLAEFKKKDEYIREKLTKYSSGPCWVEEHKMKVCRRMTDAECDLRERSHNAKKKQYEILFERYGVECIPSMPIYEMVKGIMKGTIQGDFSNEFLSEIRKVYKRRLKKKDYRLINKELPAHVRKENAHYATPKVCRAQNSSNVYQLSTMEPQGYRCTLSNGRRA